MNLFPHEHFTIHTRLAYDAVKLRLEEGSDSGEIELARWNNMDHGFKIVLFVRVWHRWAVLTGTRGKAGSISGRIIPYPPGTAIEIRVDMMEGWILAGLLILLAVVVVFIAMKWLFILAGVLEQSSTSFALEVFAGVDLLLCILIGALLRYHHESFYTYFVRLLDDDPSLAAQEEAEHEARRARRRKTRKHHA